MKNSSWQLHNL